MLSEKIKSLRSQRGLTVREFAKMASITHSMVSDFENNRKIPGRKVLKKIADAFEITESELLDDSPPIASPALKADYLDKLKIAEAIEDTMAIEILSKLIVYFTEMEEVNRKLDSVILTRSKLSDKRIGSTVLK